MHPAIRHLLCNLAAIGVAMVVMACCAALSGCGGGSVDDELRAGINPPNCAASAVCQ